MAGIETKGTDKFRVSSARTIETWEDIAVDKANWDQASWFLEEWACLKCFCLFKNENLNIQTE